MSQSNIGQSSQNHPVGGAEGVLAIIDFFKSAKEETKMLLANECDIILECRYCRSMFRSIINFTAHKRKYCTGTIGAAAANTAILWQHCLDENLKDFVNDHHSIDEKKQSHLRNFMCSLNRRATDIAVPIPGHPDPLVLHTFPRIGAELLSNRQLIGIASEEGQGGIPEDLVTVCFPTDPNFKANRTRGSRRRDGIIVNSKVKLSPLETSYLHRILSHYPELFNEDAPLKCFHTDCSDFMAFNSYAALAFHFGMRHAYRSETKDQEISCLLCDQSIKTWDSHCRHYQDVHKTIRDDHDKARIVELGLDGKRREYQRGRSLSPVTGGTELNEKEANIVVKQQSEEKEEQTSLKDTEGRRVGTRLRTPSKKYRVPEESPSCTAKEKNEVEDVKKTRKGYKTPSKKDRVREESPSDMAKKEGMKASRRHRAHSTKERATEESLDDTSMEKLVESVRPRRKRLIMDKQGEGLTKKQANDFDLASTRVEPSMDKEVPKAALSKIRRVLRPRPKKLTVGSVGKDILDCEMEQDIRDTVEMLVSKTEDLMKEELSPCDMLWPDLTKLPICLTDEQKKLFYAGLKPKDQNFDNAKKYDGSYICEYCKEVFPTLKRGHMHMTTHIRMIRLRCKLCQAGAFYWSDMKLHLQHRKCPELKRAPAECLKAGTPCMSGEQANSLTEIANRSQPGYASFTSGKIVSILNREPHFPDPVIEEKILGPSLIPVRSDQ